MAIFTDSTGIRMIETITEGGVAVPLAPFTVAQEITFRLPNGDLLGVSGTQLTDGTDGKIYYDTPEGFFDGRPGRWGIRGRVESASQEYPGEWSEFMVYPAAV
jgi:hypothetical protein